MIVFRRRPGWLMLSALFLSLCFAMAAAAETSDKLTEDFNAAFAAYESAAAEEDWKSALISSKLSYELGQNLYDARDENRIALAQNVGLVLRNLGREGASKKYFKEALSLAQSRYGENSSKVIEHLYNLGVASLKTFKKGSEMPMFYRALQISRKVYGTESVEYGTLNTNIGAMITKNAQTTQGRKYLTRGHKILQKSAGLKSKEFAMAAFHRGKFDLMTKDYNDAAKHLEQALHAFHDPETPPEHVELTTHAFLVNVYENLGQKARATEHCLAIGKMTPKRTKQEYLPVFRSAPEYPRSARRNWVNSWVDLIYDVDASGFVQNPRITNTQEVPKYQEQFNEAALEAVKGYRYAPSFEQGEPVPTKDVEIRITFRVLI